MVRVFLKYKGYIYLKFEVYTRYNNMLFVSNKVFRLPEMHRWQFASRQKTEIHFSRGKFSTYAAIQALSLIKQNLVLFLIKGSFHKRR